MDYRVKQKTAEPSRLKHANFATKEICFFNPFPSLFFFFFIHADAVTSPASTLLFNYYNGSHFIKQH